MIKTYPFFTIITLTAWAFLFACNSSSPTAGSGSKTTNTIEVSAASNSVSGTAPEGILISLYSAGYLPHLDSGFTGSALVAEDGEFSFSALDTGTYTVLAQDTSSETALIFMEVPVYPHTSGFSISDTLNLTAVISGIVYKDTLKQEAATVYIKGTPFYDSTDSSGSFLINNVPGATYTLHAEFVSRTVFETFRDTVPDVDVVPGTYASIVTFHLKQE
jgi:hypothetical protein